MPSHIVWDWNGTLLDDGRAVIGAVTAAFAALNLPPVDSARHQKHFGRPIREFYKRLAERELSDTEQLILAAEFEKAYELNSTGVTLTVDARQALAKLSEAGCTQSLLSMRPHELLLEQVDRQCITGYFAIVEGCDANEPDTKASHLKEHLHRLGVSEPRDVLLVGDTVDDALACTEAGIECVIYHSGPYALQDREHFRNMGACVVETLIDAVDKALAKRRRTCRRQPERPSTVAAHGHCPGEGGFGRGGSVVG